MYTTVVRCPMCGHELASLGIDPAMVSAMTPSPLNQPSEAPVLLSMSEAARQLGISRSTLYQLRYRGQIRTVRFGRAVRVPRSELERIARDGID